MITMYQCYSKDIKMKIKISYFKKYKISLYFIQDKEKIEVVGFII